MKRAILFGIVMFGLGKGFSQGKATLTKVETVNYIQKKIISNYLLRQYLLLRFT